MSWEIRQGDCIEAMREMDEASVDAIVTDPPYGLEFMGKEWDSLKPDRGRADLSDRENFKPTKSKFKDGVGTKIGAPQKNPRCRKCGKLKFDHEKGKCHCKPPDWNTRQSEYAYLQQVWHEAWATEALRVLKPGGHLLAFGGTRTYHRLACAVEDAGFEIRDSIAWQHMEGVFCACDNPMHRVREGFPDVPEATATSEGADLQSSVQRQASGQGMGEARVEGSESEGSGTARDEGRGESSLEGRGDVLAEEGELPGDQVRPSAGMGAADGAEGRLHHGASASDGAEAGTTTDEDGSGTSSRPRSAEQRADESGAVAVEWIAQGGGAWPGCPRCGKPLSPPFFGGPLTWKYGSGFPKSLDVSKAIDKAAGAEREIVGRGQFAARRPKGSQGVIAYNSSHDGSMAERGHTLTAPATPEAQKWNGWGTALKPAHEPIVVARKPLVGTVAQNVTEFGTGALNVDGCRIEGGKAGGSGTPPLQFGGENSRPFHANAEPRGADFDTTRGRWPPNVALSHLPECEEVGTRKVRGSNSMGTKEGHEYGAGEGDLFPHQSQRAGHDHVDEDGTETVRVYNCAPGCPVAELDRQSGSLTSGKLEPHHADNGKEMGTYGAFSGASGRESYGDTGGASRFFYVAKASRAERNAGLDGFEKQIDASGPMAARGQAGLKCRKCERWKASGNSCQCVDPDFEQIPFERPATANRHPTVKPIDLMRWLCRLVTPPGGTILDPFAGSGTTGIAAVLEDFNFIGIEREAEYVEIARARIEWWQQFPVGTEVAAALDSGARESQAREAGQLGLESV